MSITTNKLDQTDALAALRELHQPFNNEIQPACVVVQPNEIPHPADALLVHHEHMTEVLQRHYGKPVRVHVVDERINASMYTRKVRLTLAAEDATVEWGIARLDFKFMSDAIRDEILAKQTPLGAILIRHNVHRRIKPRWFMRFPPRGPMLSLFGETSDQPMYGRIGTIYCNDEPAIELLEIVTGVQLK